MAHLGDGGQSAISRSRVPSRLQSPFCIEGDLPRFQRVGPGIFGACYEANYVTDYRCTHTNTGVTQMHTHTHKHTCFMQADAVQENPTFIGSHVAAHQSHTRLTSPPLPIHCSRQTWEATELFPGPRDSLLSLVLLYEPGCPLGPRSPSSRLPSECHLC